MKAHFSILIATVMIVAVPTIGYACGIFGTDTSAVASVQSSWGPAEKAMKDGHYARAIEELRASAVYLANIRNSATRKCVAEGADIRIASAAAGEKFLSANPGDFRGAKVAADRAWWAYPLSHNCP